MLQELRNMGGKPSAPFGATFHRTGFTLVEVVIGLLILVVACLTVLMLLPKALQLQQESRLKMLAAMHAQGLIANFIGHDQDMQREETTMTPVSGRLFPNALNKDWRQWSTNRNDINPNGTNFPTPEQMHRDNRWLQAKGEFDLERVTTQIYRGNYPVPIEIAQRLESPGNEIQAILASGGQVYYSDLNGGEYSVGKGAPLTSDTTEFRKLIWGVVGPPQQNLLPFNPVAYQQVEMYPHPPQAWSRPLDRVWTMSKVTGVEFVRQESIPPGGTYKGVTFSKGLTVQYWRQGSPRTTLYPIVTGPSTNVSGKVLNDLNENVIRSPLQDYGIPVVADGAPPGNANTNTSIGGEANGMGLHERNTWEWYAKIAFDAGSSAADPRWLDDRWKDNTFRDKYNSFSATSNRIFERLYNTKNGDSFLTTVAAFRVLSNQHWSRIMGQIDEITTTYADTSISSPPVNFDGAGSSSGHWEDGPEIEVKILVYATDEQGRLIRDSMGNITYKEGTVKVKQRIWVIDPPSSPPGSTLPIPPPMVIEMETGQASGDSGITQWYDLDGDGVWTAGKDVNPNFWFGVSTGYSQPAQGLGFSRLRGTDILHEDAILVGPNRMAREVYQSMPSLERRVKYRTAALILWAKAAYGIDIRHIEDPTLAYVGSSRTDLPQAAKDAGRAALVSNTSGTNENPLYSWQNLSGFLENGQPVSNMSNWHPTQILALNYLAHASVMCTGYRPPFYRDNNTPQLDDDELLVEDEGDKTVAGNVANDAALMKRYRMLRRFGVRHDQLPFKAVDAGAMEEGVFDASNTRWNLYPALGLARDTSVTSAAWTVRAFVSTSPFTTATTKTVNVDPLSGALLLAADDYLVLEDLNGDGKFDGKGELYAEYNTNGTLKGKYSDPIIVYNRSRNYYVRNPYVQELLPNTRDIDHAVYPMPLETASPQILQTYAYGVRDPATGRLRKDVPIGYRPKCDEVLNPFPPPYADTGAFDAGGNRLYKVSWQVMMERDLASPVTTDKVRYVPRLMRTVDKGDAPANDSTDTRWARNAHEAMLRILMRYKACNPYDNTVPLPANRQIFTDRGIWQKDLFGDQGVAYRPSSVPNVIARQGAYYPLTCPHDQGEKSTRGDKMRWSMAFASPNVFNKGLFSEPVEWTNRWRGDTRGSWNCLSDRPAPVRSGDGYLFGWPEMSTSGRVGMVGDRRYDKYSQEAKERLCQLLHETEVSYNKNDNSFYSSAYQQADVLTGAIWSVMQSPRNWGVLYTTDTTNSHWNTAQIGGTGSKVYKDVRYPNDWGRLVRGPLAISDASGLTGNLHNPTNCTAVRKFDPTERCRQLVYWVADWMQYEDFESAPAAPIDWSQMPMYAYGSFTQGTVKFCDETTSERFSATAARFQNVTKDGAWQAVIWLLTNTYNPGDYLFLSLNGKTEPVEIVSSADSGTGSGYYPYWVRPRKMNPSDPDRDFSETIFYDASKLLVVKEGKTAYDTWAQLPENINIRPTWNGSSTNAATASDADLTDWADPVNKKPTVWSAYSAVNTAIGIWNPGTPVKTGEGGPPEYRFIFTSPYRLCTLSSMNRSSVHTIDANTKTGAQAGEAGYGKIYSFASPKGILCRGVPAEPFLSIAGGTLSRDQSVTMDAIGYNPFLMTGTFGADRNHDGVFSKGSIRKTERMRAEPIARFNYYDPIAWICLGQ